MKRPEAEIADEIAGLIARLYPDAENGPVEPSEPSVDFIRRNLAIMEEPSR